MIRLTPAHLKKNKMPRKRVYNGYWINQNPQVSPYVINQKVQFQEVYDRKARTLSPHLMPYYGDYLGWQQMRPYDLRKQGRIYQSIGGHDVEKAVMKRNMYDYDLNSEEENFFDKPESKNARRKYYDKYYDKWFETDGQYIAWRGWHAFSDKRKELLKDVKDPRTIVNHVTKWKDNRDKARWWYDDGRAGHQLDWHYFQSTYHEETWEFYHQNYNKFVMPTNFSDFSLKNQGYYWSWLTKTLLVQNAELENKTTDKEEMTSFEKSLKANLERNFQDNLKFWSKKQNHKRIFKQHQPIHGNNYGQFLHGHPVESRSEQILNLIKNSILTCHNFSGSEDPLLENSKTENSAFWYRGVGFINKTVWEQPHGWQIHARPDFSLRSKNGIRSSISKNDSNPQTLNQNQKVPKYNYFIKRSEENNNLLHKTQKDDVPSKWLEDIELKGTHPSHYRLPYTKYENMINSAGYNFKGGDIYPNYQESMLADKLTENPPPLDSEYKFCDWTFSTMEPLNLANRTMMTKADQFIEQKPLVREKDGELKEYQNLNYIRNNGLPTVSEDDRIVNKETGRIHRLIKNFDLTKNDQIKIQQNDQAWLAEGLSNCWASALGVAHGLGHWWENDVTLDQPIITNHVITDGKFVQFFTFEMNTLSIDMLSEKRILDDDSFYKNNVMFASPKYQLNYDQDNYTSNHNNFDVEINNFQFLDEVMKRVLRFDDLKLSREGCVVLEQSVSGSGDLSKVENEIAHVTKIIN